MVRNSGVLSEVSDIPDIGTSARHWIFNYSHCCVVAEPGYYEAGNFGIRIENIEQIVEIKPKYPSDKKFLTFKTVTMCPIQTKLIDPSLLSEEEVSFVWEARRRMT